MGDAEISLALVNEFDRAALTRTGKGETWQHLVAPFRTAKTWRSVVEYFGNFIGAGLSEAATLYCLRHLPWLTPLFVLLLAGFLIRIFITFHDCGHGSYFNCQHWNDRAGIFAGFCMLTPYYAWRKANAIHHAMAGDLDRRGTGDIYTCTVDEYLALSPRQQRNYRLARHPLMVFLGGAFILFMIMQRSTPYLGLSQRGRAPGEGDSQHPLDVAGQRARVHANWRDRRLATAAPRALTQLYPRRRHRGRAVLRPAPVRGHLLAPSRRVVVLARLARELVLDAPAEGAAVLHREHRDPPHPSPRAHHLAPKVPKYKLQRCVDSSPMFRNGVHVMGIRGAYRSLWRSVYDEHSQKLISWHELERTLAARVASSRGPGPVSSAPVEIADDNT